MVARILVQDQYRRSDLSTLEPICALASRSSNVCSCVKLMPSVNSRHLRRSLSVPPAPEHSRWPRSIVFATAATSGSSLGALYS